MTMLGRSVKTLGMSWSCFGFVVIFSSSSSSSKKAVFVLVFGLGIVAGMGAAPSEPLGSSSVLVVDLDEVMRSKSFSASASRSDFVTN